MRLLLAAIVLLLVPTPAMAADRPSLATHFAGPKNYVPAPRQFSVITATIDPAQVNDGTEMVGAYADPATATVHVQPDPAPVAVGHELGHLVDSQLLTDGDRRAFTRIMHAPPGPWNRGEATGRVDGNISPNEWFGDFYGAAATGLDANTTSLGSFAIITPKRLHNFEAALRRFGRRNHLQGLNLAEALASAR